MRFRALALVAPIVVACAPAETPTAPADSAVVLSGVRYEQVRDGRVLARARVERLSLDRADGRLDASAVSLSNGGPATLSAGAAQGSTRSARATLAGGVALAGTAGEKLETTSCDLDLARDHASGAAPTTLASGALKASGDGFEASLGKEPRIELRGHVRASLAPEPQPSVDVKHARRRGKRR